MEGTQPTNREFIYKIKNYIKESNSDTRLSNRAIWFNIYSAAKLLIDRDMNARKLFKQTNIFQTICVEMKEISKNLCSCIDIDTSCKIYRSVDKLPKIFESIFGPIIYSVLSIDGSKEIKFTTSFQANKKTKIKDNKNYYSFIEDGYLYTTSEFDYVIVKGLFEENIDKYKCDYKEDENNNSECNNWLDEKLFIPERLLEGVEGLILQKLGLFKQIPFPQNNNKDSNN